MPLARNPRRDYGRDLLIETGRGFRGFTGLRTPRYTYVEYDDGQVELYDLPHDPYELHSLDRDPRYAHVRGVLSARLMFLRFCRGRACSWRW